MAEVNIDPLDDCPDEPISPAAPVFEFTAYKHPFSLWDHEEYEEPEKVYQPIHFGIQVTEEQHRVLLDTRAASSQEIIINCRRYIEYYHAHPRPPSVPKAPKSGNKSPKLPAAELQARQDAYKAAVKERKARMKVWHKKYLLFDAELKESLTEAGWPGRLANAILEQARAKLKSARKCAERALWFAQLRHEKDPSNRSHIKLQHFSTRQNYHGFYLGDRDALVETSKQRRVLADLRKEHPKTEKETADWRRQMVEVMELHAQALEKWNQSRLFPIVSVGGKDEGKWMNKTVFLREKLAPGALEEDEAAENGDLPASDQVESLPTECPLAEGKTVEHELVIKYPKFLKPGHEGRSLPKMVIPVKLSDRALESWRRALGNKKALTFNIQPLRGLKWRVTGVFDEGKVEKFDISEGKRIGIDQNAGFIAAACVDGRRLRWIRKFKISQKGTKEEHEARITEVMKHIAAKAKEESAIVVIEDLRLAEKHKEFSGARVRRHIQRIPYGKLQEILGRIACREGVTIKKVNPAYTSVLGRYRLPGMQVHLAAAAMIAWRDLGCDQVEIFQIGETALKIQGEDSPIVVEIGEGMPYLQSIVKDPRSARAFVKFLLHVNASNAHDRPECDADGTSLKSRSTAGSHTHEGEPRVRGSGGRTSHEQTRPAAGAGPQLTVLIRPKTTRSRVKRKPKPKTMRISP